MLGQYFLASPRFIIVLRPVVTRQGCDDITWRWKNVDRERERRVGKEKYIEKKCSERESRTREEL